MKENSGKCWERYDVSNDTDESAVFGKDIADDMLLESVTCETAKYYWRCADESSLSLLNSGDERVRCGEALRLFGVGLEQYLHDKIGKPVIAALRNNLTSKTVTTYINNIPRWNSAFADPEQTVPLGTWEYLSIDLNNLKEKEFNSHDFLSELLYRSVYNICKDDDTIQYIKGCVSLVHEIRNDVSHGNIILEMEKSEFKKRYHSIVFGFNRLIGILH